MKIKPVFRGLFYLGVAASLTLPALQYSPAKALPQTPDKKMMHDRLQEAVNDLNLNDDQKGKLKDVFTDAKSKRETIMSDSSLTADQKKDKMKALHQDTISKVNEVLTPDQRAQLKEKLEAAKKAPDANYPH
jgi:Spy/CpxP family protein refolding chaperone